MSEIRRWIDKLNTMSIPDIRKLMVDEGIKGHRFNSTGCVIALFLRSKDSTVRDLSVTPTTICYVSSNDQGIVACSSALSKFIVHFDYGWFSELDAEAIRTAPKWTVHFDEMSGAPYMQVHSSSGAVLSMGGVIHSGQNTTTPGALIKQHLVA